MPEPKELTTAELLAANIDSLTTDQLVRRSAIISMQKNEREMELAIYENDKFRNAKEERIRMRKIAVENSAAERAKTEAEQLGCAHNTGGEGLSGFFAGDGSIYGSATAGLELPTGELYYLCFRCQKEWHHPRWTGGMRAVIEGEITLEQYREQERQYNEIARRPRKSFQPWNGEFCSASKFNIPLLQARMAKDASDFEAYLHEQKPGRKQAQARV